MEARLPSRREEVWGQTAGVGELERLWSRELTRELYNHGGGQAAVASLTKQSSLFRIWRDIWGSFRSICGKEVIGHNERIYYHKNNQSKEEGRASRPAQAGTSARVQRNNVQTCGQNMGGSERRERVHNAVPVKE
jgi:hypothetical protein